MSFIFLLLYISAIYIRPQEWVRQVYGWPLINILAIATAVCVFIEAGFRERLRAKEPQMLLLLAFLGSIAMSHIAHTYFWGMWDSVVKFSSNVIMFFLFINALNSERKIRMAIWFIILLTVVLAVQGIDQYEKGIGWAGQEIMTQTNEKTGEVTRRITWVGIMSDPNDLALTYAVAVGFLIALIFGKTGLPVKLIGIPCIAVMLKALMLTASRGGKVTLGACVSFYVLSRFRNRKFAIAIGLILLAVILFVGPIKMAGDESAGGRIQAWYEGFQMLKGAPIFGVGYGMFMEYHERTAHNTYILVAAEEGLVGFYIFIALIYGVFAGLGRLIKDRAGSSPYALGMLTALVGFMSASYFLSRAHVPMLYILLALGSSFLYVYLRPDQYSFDARSRKTAAFLSIVILSVVWLSARISLKLGG